MEINEAVQVVEDFLLKLREEQADWSPEEIRVRPSGDDQATIKIWLGFPGSTKTPMESLKQQAVDAVKAAHPDLEYKLEVRAERFSLDTPVPT